MDSSESIKLHGGGGGRGGSGGGSGGEEEGRTIIRTCIDKIEIFANEENIHSLLDMCEEEKASPGIEFASSLFEGDTNDHILQILSLFLAALSSFNRIYFYDLRPSNVRNYVGMILRRRIKRQIDEKTIYYQLAPDHPASAIPENIIDRLVTAAFRTLESREKKKIPRISPTSPKAKASTILDLVSQDSLVSLAMCWGNPTELILEDIAEYSPVHFACENHFVGFYTEENPIDFDRYYKYIGAVCYHSVSIMFRSKAIIPTILENIMKTWIHAAIGMTRIQHFCITGELSVNIPTTPPPNTADWMLDILDDFLVQFLLDSVIAAVVDKHRSLLDYLITWDTIKRFATRICCKIQEIRGFITPEEAVDAATHLYVHATFANLFMDMHQSDSEGGEGGGGGGDGYKTCLLRAYQNISDLALYTKILTPDIFKACRGPIQTYINSMEGVAPPCLHNGLPIVIDSAIPPSVTYNFADRILSQTIEYNRCTIAAGIDIRSLPFNVQGEAFIYPMTSAYYSPLSSCLRFDAFVRLVSAAQPRPFVDTVVQLASQLCFFNKQEIQHDYLFHQPKWVYEKNPKERVGGRGEGLTDADTSPLSSSSSSSLKESNSGVPDVYTAIINLNKVDMIFEYTAVGRSSPINVTRRSKSSIPKTDPITLGPGQIMIYKRVDPLLTGAGNMSWQCRLSECRQQAGTGIVYMQTSIAVYHGGEINEDERREIATTVKTMEVGGVVSNRIYTGTQRFERHYCRRFIYPSLYQQLTNAFKKKTMGDFLDNFAYLQNPIITTVFAQAVVLVKTEDVEEYRLVTPKRDSVAYNEQIGYQLEYQKMVYSELIENISDVSKRVNNTSVGVTKEVVKAVYGNQEKTGILSESSEYISYIYSNNPPPLRNLVGLLQSKRDNYVANRPAPKWELALFGYYI